MTLANAVNSAESLHNLEDWAIMRGWWTYSSLFVLVRSPVPPVESLVRKNVPPDINAARALLAFIGVNLLDLDCRGFLQDRIQRLKTYRTLRSERKYSPGSLKWPMLNSLSVKRKI